MAGDWIKVETCTPGKAEIIRLARLLSMSHREALGAVVQFWIWADSNSVDGAVDGVALQDVDAVVSCPGLCAALEMVGWLKVDKANERILIPKFERHNGDSAKKRALSNNRQAKWRNASVDGHVDGGASTKASTREEKRREEIKDKDIVGLKPDLRQLAKEVLNFLNSKTGKKYEPVPANVEMIVARLKEGATADDCRAVIAKKCREWATDEKMAQFLRPKTLFSRTNFANYAGEVK